MIPTLSPLSSLPPERTASPALVRPKNLAADNLGGLSCDFRLRRRYHICLSCLMFRLGSTDALSRTGVVPRTGLPGRLVGFLHFWRQAAKAGVPPSGGLVLAAEATTPTGGRWCPETEASETLGGPVLRPFRSHRAARSICTAVMHLACLPILLGVLWKNAAEANCRFLSPDGAIKRSVLRLPPVRAVRSATPVFSSRNLCLDTPLCPEPCAGNVALGPQLC